MKTTRRLLSTTTLNRSIKLVVATGAMALSAAPAWAVDDLATPVGEAVVGGAASFERPEAGQLNIHQSTDRVVINWDSFNIGKNASTQFYQPGSGSLAVNRVTGSNQDPTQILGSLKANGRVMVLDRNGVFFGPNSRVDVGGIIASTGDVDTASVMNGDAVLQLKNIANGEVVNAGLINVSEAGLAAFVAPTVRNSGVINAKLGKVALAAGSTNATVDLYGDGLVEFALDGAKTKALSENTGEINAEGGTVALSASAAKDVVDDVINMSGVVNVSSVTVKGGKIILGGGNAGKVKVSGKLKASGPQGGKIDLKGKTIAIEPTAEISANGAGGEVVAIAADRNSFKGLITATGDNSFIEVSGHDLELGGEIASSATGSVLFDPITLTIGAGEAATLVSSLAGGGTVIAQASERIIVNAAIDSSAQVGGGTLYLKDEGGTAGLQIDLNQKITLGTNQTLKGDGTIVNVASTGLIQNGVDSALAGATVNVAAGTFAENVRVTKGLILNGANAGVNPVTTSRGAETIVSAAGGNGFFIKSSDVVIDGFTINNPDVGVKSDGTPGQYGNLTVQNTIINNASLDAIRVYDSFAVGIFNNFASNSGDRAYEVRRTEGVTISGNRSDTTGDDGIFVQNSNAVEITNNQINNAGQDGIDVNRGDYAIVTGNVVNTVGDDGIDVAETADINISGNYIYNSFSNGIEVGHLAKTLIEDNYVYLSAYDGITVRQVTPTVIEEPVIIGRLAPDGSDYSLRIIDNDVDVSGDDGIEAYDIAGNVYVADNTVYQSGTAWWNTNPDGYGADGIHIRNVGAPIVTVAKIGDVPVADSDYKVVITNNEVGHRYAGGEDSDIAGAKDDGIEVLNSGRTYIGQNRISFVGLDLPIVDGRVALVEDGENQYGDGIRVYNVYADDYDGSASVEIDDNDIYQTGDDGIDVSYSGRTYIHDNTVEAAGYNSTPDYYGADGISVRSIYANDYLGSMSSKLVFGGADAEAAGWIFGVEIIDNTVDGTDDDGIEVVGAPRTLIQGNDVFNAGYGSENWADGYGADGIHVRDVHVYDAPYEEEYEYEIALLPDEDDTPTAVEIIDNRVNVIRATGEFSGNTADDGIQVLYSGDTLIDANHVANSGTLSDDDDGEVYLKEVFAGPQDWWGADGIHVLTGDTRVPALAKGILGYGDVKVEVEVTNNFVDISQDDGIEIEGGYHVLADNNNVDVSGDDGIRIVGYNGYYGEGSVDKISAMLIDFDPWYSTAVATNNVVNNSGNDGIEINNYNQIDASFNTVSNSQSNGIYISGGENGDVNVEGNTLTSNDIGVHFESGYIDLTGASNFINGGRVGLRFAPFEYYYGEGGYYAYMELVDDDAPGVSPAAQNPPDNFGGTIGRQVFNGQSQYFVELDNGAFFYPGTPTWLNGLNSTYNGIAPSVTNGIIEPSQLAFLEEMFYHWVDDGTLGRFWFGAAGTPSLAGIDQEDIFREFDPLAGIPGQVNVILLGLPRLPGSGLPPSGGGDLAAMLNSLGPAAGGDETGNMSPDQLNQIATAAGDAAQNGQPTSCWMDASMNAQTAGATTFSFSSVINQDTLEQESNCGATVQTQ